MTSPASNTPSVPEYHDAMCEKCSQLALQRIETVEDRGPGFKCSQCGWWNWLRDREWSM